MASKCNDLTIRVCVVSKTFLSVSLFTFWVNITKLERFQNLPVVCGMREDAGILKTAQVHAPHFIMDEQTADHSIFKMHDGQEHTIC